MKKFVLGLLTGAIIFSTVAFAVNYTAKTASFKVTVDGEAYTPKSPIVVINGSTYMPVKEMGQVIGAGVVWNAETQTVEIYRPTVG